MSSQSYKEAIAVATKEILHEIPNAVVIGQGVCDPTRIFGTTAGLIEEFGSERIIDMPIMEEGMTGIAIGMALNGLVSNTNTHSCRLSSFGSQSAC